MQHSERWAPNATLELLARGAGWRALLGRLGARALLGLLTHGSVALFVGLGNGNYLQVAGRPVTEVRGGVGAWGAGGGVGGRRGRWRCGSVGGMRVGGVGGWEWVGGRVELRLRKGGGKRARSGSGLSSNVLLQV